MAGMIQQFDVESPVHGRNHSSVSASQYEPSTSPSYSARLCASQPCHLLQLNLAPSCWQLALWHHFRAGVCWCSPFQLCHLRGLLPERSRRLMVGQPQSFLTCWNHHHLVEISSYILRANVEPAWLVITSPLKLKGWNSMFPPLFWSHPILTSSWEWNGGWKHIPLQSFAPLKPFIYYILRVRM